MEFYTNVTKRQYSNGKGLPNYGVYDAKARIQKAEQLKKAEAERVAAMTEAAEIKRSKAEEEATRYTLEAYKRTVINELSSYIPLLVMNEGFTRIMMEAMPHDDDYKTEHKAAIETVNRVWLHHLGGFKYLKEQAPSVKGVLADPVGSTMGGGEHSDYDIEGIGNDFIPDTMDISLVDRVVKITDAEAFAYARLLASREGIFAGSSSGGALSAALKLVKDGARGNVVVVFPDRGDRYFSKRLYENQIV